LGFFSWIPIAALNTKDTYTTEIDSVEFGPITFYPTFTSKEIDSAEFKPTTFYPTSTSKETKDHRFTNNIKNNTPSKRECQKAS
jgi:hypothetical protein